MSSEIWRSRTLSTASKFLCLFLCFVLILSVLTLFGTNVCKSKPIVVIAVPGIESTNLTDEQSRRVTSVVRSEVSNYGTVRNSNSGADIIVAGLASRADGIYIITLSVEDLRNNKTKQTTKNLKGSFEDFLNKKVKSAVSEIMR